MKPNFPKSNKALHQNYLCPHHKLQHGRASPFLLDSQDCFIWKHKTLFKKYLVYWFSVCFEKRYLLSLYKAASPFWIKYTLDNFSNRRLWWMHPCLNLRLQTPCDYCRPYIHKRDKPKFSTQNSDSSLSVFVVCLFLHWFCWGKLQNSCTVGTNSTVSVAGGCSTAETAETTHHSEYFHQPQRSSPHRRLKLRLEKGVDLVFSSTPKSMIGSLCWLIKN